MTQKNEPHDCPWSEIGLICGCADYARSPLEEEAIRSWIRDVISHMDPGTAEAKKALADATLDQARDMLATAAGSLSYRRAAYEPYLTRLVDSIRGRIGSAYRRLKG